MREQGHGQILAQTRVVLTKRSRPGTKAALTQGGDRAQQPELTRAHQGGCRFRQVEHVGIRSLIPPQAGGGLLERERHSDELPKCNDYEQHIAWAEYCRMMESLALKIRHIKLNSIFRKQTTSALTIRRRSCALPEMPLSLHR